MSTKKLATIVAVALAVLLLLGGIALHVAYSRGVEDERDRGQDEATRIALDSTKALQKRLAVALESARREAARTDSISAAALASDSVARRREATTRTRLRIVSNGTAIQVDNQPPTPVPATVAAAVSSELDNMDVVKMLDSLAIVGLKAQVRSRDVELAVSDSEYFALFASDTLHQRQTREAVAEGKVNTKRAFWSGVRWGLGGTLAILGGLAVLLKS